MMKRYLSLLAVVVVFVTAIGMFSTAVWTNNHTSMSDKFLASGFIALVGFGGFAVAINIWDSDTKKYKRHDR